MANPKGNAANLTNAGKGRPRGSRNKFTKLKDDYLEAFEKMGGVEGLYDWAKTNKTEFYRLTTKLFPKITELTGLDGGPVEFTENKADQLTDDELASIATDNSGK